MKVTSLWVFTLLLLFEKFLDITIKLCGCWFYYNSKSIHKTSILKIILNFYEAKNNINRNISCYSMNSTCAVNSSSKSFKNLIWNFSFQTFSTIIFGSFDYPSAEMTRRLISPIYRQGNGHEDSGELLCNSFFQQSNLSYMGRPQVFHLEVWGEGCETCCGKGRRMWVGRPTNWGLIVEK